MFKAIDPSKSLGMRFQSEFPASEGKSGGLPKQR